VNDFSQPRKQEPIGVIVMFLENVRKIIRMFIAIIAFAVLKNDIGMYVWIGAGFVITVTAVITWLQFEKFKFYIEDGELILQKGLFVKEKLNIPFERIQTVNLQQNIVQQVLGLTGLKIDTAGSGKEELNIRALKKDDALALQEALDSAFEPAEDSEVQMTKEGVEATNQKLNYQTLVKLNLKQLLLLGATENHLRSGFIAFALIWGYGSQLAEYFSDYSEAVTEDIEANLIQAGWIGLLIFITLFILFSVVTSFGRVILKFFNLHAQLNNENLQVKAGLLKRNEHTIPLNKIQIIQWEDNFIRRYFKFKSLKLFQGRSEETVNSKKTIEVPACFHEQEEKVMEVLFPDSHQQLVSETFSPHIHQARILAIVFSILSLLAASALLIISSGALLAVAPVLMSGIIFLSWKYVKTISFTVGNKQLCISKGWLFKKEIFFKTYRCQGVEYKQSIFLKRRKLAHLTIHTAAGSRIIRYLKEEDCLKAYNYLLSEIEKHKGSWM